jgi:hypothetical protein
MWLVKGERQFTPKVLGENSHHQTRRINTSAHAHMRWQDVFSPLTKQGSKLTWPRQIPCRFFREFVKEQTVDVSPIQLRLLGLQIYSLHSYLKTIIRSMNYADYEECLLLGYDVTCSGRNIPKLWVNVLRPSSGRKRQHVPRSVTKSAPDCTASHIRRQHCSSSWEAQVSHKL